MNTLDDVFENGRWLQRIRTPGKYVWTHSGVLWNNIKVRTNPNGVQQKREPSYIGSINDFESFHHFTEWNRSQIGYGIGYDLDSDMLRSGVKRYSPGTCLLIPPSLNRFIQKRNKCRLHDLPRGFTFNNGSLVVKLTIKDDVTGETKFLVNKNVSSIEEGKELYAKAFDKAKEIWVDRLENSGRYCVDNRAIEYVKRMSIE